MIEQKVKKHFQMHLPPPNKTEKKKKEKERKEERMFFVDTQSAK